MFSFTTRFGPSRSDRNILKPVSSALIFFAVLVLTSCSQDNETPPTPSVPRVVTLATLTPQPIAETVEAVGTVRSAHPTVLAAKTTSAVVAVHVKAGQQVRAGQVLITLDDREFQAQVQKAQAGRRDIDHALAEVDHAIVAADKALDAATVQQDLTKVTLTRYTTLLEDGAVARRDYDTVTAQHKTATATREQTAARKAALQAKRRQMLAKIALADADLKQAHVALSYATLVAPRTGVVTTRRAEVGMLATPGTPLLTLDSEDYVLEATLRESDAAKVRIGQQGRVRIDALQQTLSGVVSEILPAHTPLSRTMTVKVPLPPTPGLRSGLYGKSQFVVGQRPGLLVPATALVERGQLQSVFIVGAHKRAHMRLVTTGKITNDGVEILSGVDAGERVAVRGADALADGMRVTEERAP